MDVRKKHWSEIGRVKNSDWFRSLPASEKEAVLAALEHDTHESAVKLRGTLAFIYILFIYAAAGVIWGLAFRTYLVWLVAAGAAIGAFVGLLSRAVIASQKTPASAKDMQWIAGTMLGGLGIVVFLDGLRLLFSH